MPVILIPSKPLNKDLNSHHECRLSLDSNDEESKETISHQLNYHHSKSHCLPVIKSEENAHKEDDDPFFQCLVSYA